MKNTFPLVRISGKRRTTKHKIGELRSYTLKTKNKVLHKEEETEDRRNSKYRLRENKPDVPPDVPRVTVVKDSLLTLRFTVPGSWSNRGTNDDP